MRLHNCCCLINGAGELVAAHADNLPRIVFLMQSTKLRANAFLLTSVLLLGAGCATHHIAQQPNGHFQVKDTFNQYSPEDEVQVGRQAEAEANKQLPILPESNPIAQYIERLGEDLAAKAPGYKYPYSFHVVNEKDINAFALPG